MNLLVDSNIVFAALIKHGKTIEIILDKKFNFFAPEFLLEEFAKYKETILEKTHRTEDQFSQILSNLKEIIKLVPNKEFKGYLKEASNICPDKKDIDYFALALKLKYPIWSNDKRLKEQDKIDIYSSEDLIKMLEL